MVRYEAGATHVSSSTLMLPSFQRFQLSLIVRLPDVLDVPRPTPRRIHDLHHRRARLGFHRPDIRHQATLRAAVSAQVQLPQTANHQVTIPLQQRPSKLGLSQG